MNLLLKIIPGVVAVVVVAVVLLGRGYAPEAVALPTPESSGALSRESAVALQLEADTESGTVATLVAEVKSLKSSVGELLDDNARLRQTNGELSHLERSVTAQLRREMQNALAEEREQSRLTRQAERSQTALTQAALSQQQQVVRDSTEVVWIEPVGQQVPAQGLLANKLQGNSLLRLSRDSDRVPTLASTRPVPAKPQNKPVYTVPKNATLMGARTLTALIGRVPFDGKVTDPYRFKVVVGADNFLANGFQLPELDRAIVSGVAAGDWGLSCSRGEVRSITFIFHDGSIRTIPKPADAFEGSTTEDIALGYLSDPMGIPCITGQRISNASTYLSQSVAVAAVGAAGEAAAASQTVTASSIGGGGISSGSIVDGNTGQYVAGRTISDTAHTTAEYLAKRAANAWDVVFVAANTPVAVHITEQLTIDIAPDHRRVRHTQPRIATRALD